MTKQIIGTILALVHIAGIIKSFSISFILGIISVFVPPVSIYMLFFY